MKRTHDFRFVLIWRWPISKRDILGDPVLWRPRGCPGGGGGWHTSKFHFIRGGSAPRSKPLPFDTPFLTEKVPLSYTFHIKNCTPFISLRSYFFQTFHLRNPLKYLTESAVRCVCSRYFDPSTFLYFNSLKPYPFIGQPEKGKPYGRRLVH